MNAPAAPKAVTENPKAAPISHDKLRVSAKLVALVTPFMAAADIRYYLCGICIRPHPAGGAVIVATNGHMLGAVHDPDGVCEHEVILRLAPTTIAACKARGNNPRHLEMRHGRLMVCEPGREVALQAGDPVIEAAYPQFQNVIPPAASLRPGMLGQFNTAYIAVLDKVAKIAHPTRGPMQAVSFFHVEGNPKSSAIARLPAEPNFVAVLMPQAAEEVMVLPSWCAGMARKDDLAAATGAA
jgi:DNA polymerase-3 subunit beta